MSLTGCSTQHSTVDNELTSRRVSRKINLAYGPWIGGIWETNVKSIKAYLQHIIANQILTYEELNTVLIHVVKLHVKITFCFKTA